MTDQNEQAISRLLEQLNGATGGGGYTVQYSATGVVSLDRGEEWIATSPNSTDMVIYLRGMLAGIDALGNALARKTVVQTEEGLTIR